MLISLKSKIFTDDMFNVFRMTWNSESDSHLPESYQLVFQIQLTFKLFQEWGGEMWKHGFETI